jgi:hypothetical protein
MVDLVESSFPKHCLASQQTPDGKPIINSTLMPSYALTSIHLQVIIPIILNLL